MKSQQKRSESPAKSDKQGRAQAKDSSPRKDPGSQSRPQDMKKESGQHGQDRNSKH